MAQKAPDFVNTKKYRRDLARQKEAELLKKRAKQKKMKIGITIASSCLALFLIIFSTVSIVSCVSKKYTPIKISDFYSSESGSKGVSQAMQDLDKQYVVISGYMCNSANISNKMMYIAASPGAECPFCYDVYADAMPILYSNPLKTIKYTKNKISVYGKLEVKTKKDVDGFDTPFRIYIDKIEEVS